MLNEIQQELEADRGSVLGRILLERRSVAEHKQQLIEELQNQLIQKQEEIVQLIKVDTGNQGTSPGLSFAFVSWG